MQNVYNVVYSCVATANHLFSILLREPDGQASGGNDFGNDDWIFTIREKDPKKLQNGASPTGDEVRDSVTWSSNISGCLSQCVMFVVYAGTKQETPVPESVRRHHSSLNRGRNIKCVTAINWPFIVVIQSHLLSQTHHFLHPTVTRNLKREFIFKKLTGTFSTVAPNVLTTACDQITPSVNGVFQSR